MSSHSLKSRIAFFGVGGLKDAEDLLPKAIQLATCVQKYAENPVKSMWIPN